MVLLDTLWCLEKHPILNSNEKKTLKDDCLETKNFGRQRGRGFGALAQVIGQTENPFSRKYIVPAAKPVGAELLDFAVPKITQVFGGRKKFKTAAKNEGRKTLGKQLGSGSKKKTASKVISLKTAERTNWSRRQFYKHFSVTNFFPKLKRSHLWIPRSFALQGFRRWKTSWWNYGSTSVWTFFYKDIKTLSRPDGFLLFVKKGGGFFCASELLYPYEEIRLQLIRVRPNFYMVSDNANVSVRSVDCSRYICSIALKDNYHKNEWACLRQLPWSSTKWRLWKKLLKYSQTKPIQSRKSC